MVVFKLASCANKAQVILLLLVYHNMDSSNGFLNHIMKKSIDFILTITKFTAFNEMVCFLALSSCCCVQLERPQIVGDILEIGANSENFMDDILNTNNSSQSSIKFCKSFGCFLRFTLKLKTKKIMTFRFYVNECLNLRQIKKKTLMRK